MDKTAARRIYAGGNSEEICSPKGNEGCAVRESTGSLYVSRISESRLSDRGHRAAEREDALTVDTGKIRAKVRELGTDEPTEGMT